MHVRVCTCVHVRVLACMQEDGSACGVFACAYAELLVRGAAPDGFSFSQVRAAAHSAWAAIKAAHCIAWSHDHAGRQADVHERKRARRSVHACMCSRHAFGRSAAAACCFPLPVALPALPAPSADALCTCTYMSLVMSRGHVPCVLPPLHVLQDAAMCVARLC